MWRYLLVAWLCAGAFGLGLLTVEANRRRVLINKTWFPVGLALGPIFLFFVLPLWMYRWGRRGPDDDPR